VWGARIQHRADRFALSLARTSEFGGRSSLIGGLGEAIDTLVLSDEGGRFERWHASAEFTAPGYWPSVVLRGTHFRMQGRSAVRLPGDLSLAEVESTGRLEGLRFDIELASPRLGTAVSFVWEGVEDADDVLGTLAGAERWERRAVEIRQRLGWRQLWGTRCFLMLGLSDHDVEAPSRVGEGTPAAARLALLERRRVSGGLAVAF
jgi:hypothetical protein